MTWGHDRFGGNSSAVQHQLKHVRQIQANLTAFAAIQTDGSLVSWGCDLYGGGSNHNAVEGSLFL